MRHVTITLASSLCALSFACACGGGTEYRARGTGALSEVELEVEMSTTFAGNHPMTVEVDELPPPRQLDARRYAVWTLPRGEADPRLAGYLAYDRDARSGRLETTTPYAELTVIVTAEGPGTPEQPSDTIVARRAIVHRPG